MWMVEWDIENVFRVRPVVPSISINIFFRFHIKCHNHKLLLTTIPTSTAAVAELKFPLLLSSRGQTLDGRLWNKNRTRKNEQRNIVCEWFSYRTRTSNSLTIRCEQRPHQQWINEWMQQNICIYVCWVALMPCSTPIIWSRHITQ